MSDNSMDAGYMQSRTQAAQDAAAGRFLAPAAEAPQSVAGTDTAPKPTQDQAAGPGDASKRQPGISQVTEDGVTFDVETRDDGSQWLLGRTGTPHGGTSMMMQGPQGAQTDTVPSAGAIARFVTELPMQTVGAAVDTAQGISDLARVASGFLDKNAPMGFAKDEQGGMEFVHPFMDRERIAQLQAIPDNTTVKFPEVPKASTLGGEFYRNVMRFAIGMKGVNAGLADMGLTASTDIGKLGMNTLSGVLTNVMVTKEDDKNLAALVQQYPFLANPITEALSTKDDDTVIERKLKMAVEGAGLTMTAKAVSAVTSTLTSAVKNIRNQRALSKGLEGADQTLLQESPLKMAADQAKRDIMILGDPTAPLVTKIDVPHPDAVVRDQLDKGLSGAVGAIDEAHGAGSVATIGERAPLVTKMMPNFARVNGPEDIEAALNEMAAANGIPKGRVVTQADTHAAAKEMGVEELLTLDIKTMGINAAKLDALKDFYASSAALVKQTADVAYAAPTDGNLFAFRKALAVHQALLEKFSAARSEAGRTLGILKRFSDAGDMERLASMTDFIEGMGGRDVAMALVEKVKMIQNGSADALNGVVKRGAGARTLDAVTEAWTMGLVSGARSQGRNILSNASYALMQIPERMVAARLPGATVEEGEATAMVAGYLASFRQAFVNAGKSFWTGTTDIGVGAAELPHRKAIGGDLFDLPDGNARRVADAFGELWRVWGRSLNAADAFFKTINYSGEMYAQAWRVALQEGGGEAAAGRAAQLLASPTDAMRVAAMQAAQRGTFTQTPGALAQAIQKMKYDDNLAVALSARFIFPFVKTPANVTRTGLSYTPMAALMPRTFWNEISKGGASRDLALTKMAVGSSLMATWADLTMRGDVTGNGPSNPADRDAWRNAGYEPYSVKIGDKWVNYRTFEPIGMPLAMAADVTEKLIEYSKLADSDDPRADEKMDKLAVASFAALGNAFLSQTFSRGYTMLAATLDNPDMKAEQYVEQTASSVVPRAVSSFHEMVGSPGNNVYKDVNGAWEAIDAELRPWTAIPMRDVFGEPRYKQETYVPLQNVVGTDTPVVSPMMRILEAVSPVYTGERVGSPIAMEIFNQGIKISRAGKAQTFHDPDTGQNVTMDLKQWPEVWDRFQVLAGHELKHPSFETGLVDLLNSIVEGRNDLSEIYKSKPDGDEQGVDNKGQFIKGLFATYRDEARKTIMEDQTFREFQSEVSRRGRRLAAINMGNQQ